MEFNHEVKDSIEREQMTNAAVQLAQREREDKAAAEERAKQEAAQKAVFVKEFPSLQPATPAPTASREAPSITAGARSYMALCMRVSQRVPTPAFSIIASSFSVSWVILSHGL